MSKDQRRGIVGIVAVLYGLGVAFGPNLVANDGFWKLWLAIGAFVVGALWLALMVLPWAQARTDRPS